MVILHRKLVALALLAIPFAVGEAVHAATPAIVEGPVQIGVVEGPPECGAPGARPRIYQQWDAPQAEQKCRVILEIVDDSNDVLRSTQLLETPQCSHAALVCEPGGSAVVAMANAWPVTSWVLQRLTPGGELDGDASIVIPDARCDAPEAWNLTPGGELLGADDCPNGATQAVALRRFPLDGGTEPEPVWLREASRTWIHAMAIASDDAGHHVVVWAELHDNGRDDYDSRAFARALDREFEVIGETLPLEGAGSAWLSGVTTGRTGVFTVTAHSYLAGGPVAFSISVDPDLYATASTTTTTMPPSSDAPVFDRIRFLGSAEAAPQNAIRTEGTLVSLAGGARGDQMLRRTLLERSWNGRFGTDGATQAHVSSSSGLRWKRADSSPQSEPYELLRDRVSDRGTILSAKTAARTVGGEAYEYSVVVIEVARSANGASRWSDPVVATTLFGAGSDSYVHDIALAAGEGGLWLLATSYSRQVNGGWNETWRTMIDVAWSYDDGRTWVPGPRAWEETFLVEQHDIEEELRPWLAASHASDGSWGIVWRKAGNGGVWAARASAPASTWQSQPIEPPVLRPANIPLYDWTDWAMPYGRPSFVTTPGGAWVVAWQQEHLPIVGGHDSDIHFARSMDNGAHWEVPVPLGPRPAGEAAHEFDPSLATDAAGRVLAVWSSHDPLGGTAGLDADIVSSISLDGGASWTPPALVDPAAKNDERQDRSPFALASAGGVWTVAWTTFPHHARWSWEQDDTTVKVALSGSSCGNGAVERGEECDDGNAADGDGCNANCSLRGCGNEVVEDGEACDYGDAASTGECTPECTTSTCGDGYLNPWTEQCDDGNADTTDSCPHACRLARCGDGFAWSGREQCDDGNDAYDDACDNSCRAAYCGDGFVLAGVETCDDGDEWGGNPCTDLCEPARCGDGRVWIGVEHCDDPDGSVHDGNCTAECRFVDPCSDADASGATTVGDALTILRSAVALGDVCTPDRCDVNGSGAITAMDASGALRTSAGLPVELACPLAGLASFVLEDSAPIAALQLAVRFASSGLGFGLGDGRSHCDVLVTGALSASSVHPDGTLVLAIIRLDGFQGPLELARCPVFARRRDPGVGSVEIVIDDATDADGNRVSPLPQVRLVTH